MPPPEKTILRFLTNKTIYFLNKIANNCNRNLHYKKLAFTLAETLITIGIIGIVAAMTLPSLIQDHREKETVAKLKKINSILGQALASAINDTGTTVDQWYLEGGDSKNGSQVLVDDYFKPYFKIADDCEKLRTCIGGKKYKYLNGTEHISYDGQNSYKHLVLADGTLLIFHISPEFKNCPQKGNCAEIFVDTNGYYRGPNQFGRDFFVFSMKKEKIIPYGTKKDFPNFSTHCNKIKGTGYGLSCGAWVIQNENMDYLHCDDLEWGKKIRCK